MSSFQEVQQHNSTIHNLEIQPHNKAMFDAQSAAPAIDWQEMREREHFVQFYERDEFLIASVAGFVGEGLRAGDPVIVIATDSHRSSLNQRLREDGIDLKAARTEGRYILLDAAATLAKFMVNGAPDEKLFQENVANIVKRAVRNGKHVRAFGEMVALLWAEGNSDGAIRLEQLWNEFGKEHSFALFCAYPMNGFCDSANGQPLIHICKEHTRVIPSESYSAQTDADARLREIASLQQQAQALRAEVAERKRVEKELRRSKEELSAFIENSSLGLHWVRPDGIIQWANRAELELLGYDKEDYVGHHISEFYVDKKLLENILERLSRGETLRNQEVQLRCKDGSTKHVLIDSSVFWEDGKFVHTQCFTRDITERKVMEVAARRLVAIVESSEDAIISKDLNGIITSWNPSAERIFGYTAQEAIGKSVTILIPTDHIDEEPKILGRIRRGERIEHYETERKAKDGRLIDISLTVSPIKDVHGKIVGASKIARDISDRKKAERAIIESQRNLARANEDLERRVAERTAALQEAVHQMEEFSYTLSHDLRGPLRAMQGYCHILLEEAANELSPENLPYLKRIGQSAERLDRLGQDVLSYTRVGRAEMKMKPLNTEQVIMDVLRTYAPDQHPIPEIVIDRPLLDVMGHEAALVQCVSNLIGNAFKFVSPGAVPRVHLWTERVDNQVRLWVEDNGFGISKDQHEKIFNMFERLPEVRDYPGTGVGLAIVKKAINRMQGEVGVESTPGKGSRFWIQLPAAKSMNEC
jgi:PAS domain S-box-containing protein